MYRKLFPKYKAREGQIMPKGQRFWCVVDKKGKIVAVAKKNIWAIDVCVVEFGETVAPCRVIIERRKKKK
jgi:hypothetical protein